jgi:outer membrane protein TolC
MKIKFLFVPLWILFQTALATGDSLPRVEPESGFALIEENGQQMIAVSLREVLHLALVRNVNMGVLDINQQIAEDTYEASKKDNNPKLSTSVTSSRDVGVSGTNLSGDHFSVIGHYPLPYLSFAGRDSTVFSTTLDKKDKLGVHYSLSYNKSYLKTLEGSIETDTDPPGRLDGIDDALYVDSIAAGISIPILQDWGDINRIYEYRSSIELEKTGYGNRQSRLSLVQKAANLYWELVRSRYTIQAQLTAVQLARQLLSESTIRHELGFIDKVGVKQSENQLVYVNQRLLSEQVRKKQIEDQLQSLLNLDQTTYAYQPTEPMTVRNENLDFGALIQEIYENNQNLKILYANVRTNQLALEEMENRDAPDMDLIARYQINGYDKKAGKAFENVSDTDLSDYQVGIRLNVPLFDKVTAQKIREIKLNDARIKLQMKDLKMQLEVNLKNILQNLGLARQEIDLAKARVDLLDDIVYKETEKLKVGNTGSYQVAQVQQDLIEAKNDEILSKVQYEKTYMELLLLTERVFTVYELGSLKDSGMANLR